MAKTRWLWIILGMVAGVFSPWQYQVAALVALLMGYAACYSLQWKQFQLLLAYLYGGLATGLGLQILIANASHHEYILMVIQPLLTWLVLHIFFYGFETKYTLHPNAVVSQMRAEDEREGEEAPAAATGHSAWSGDTYGQASIPDKTGRYMNYHFYCTGEIAMGGPTYGDAIFGNNCAFSGVGPSIVLSDDGRYAAMTLPSRAAWGLLLADLQEKLVYKPKDVSTFWEIDRIENAVIYGRYSPLTSNSVESLAITEIETKFKAEPLVEDDGWWVMDYPERRPFPKYEAVTIKSKQGAHKVTFVPDLKPFKANPFERAQHPRYTVLVDDELLDLESGFPSAYWLDGKINDSEHEGRFLFYSGRLFDFKDKALGKFSVKNRIELPYIKGCDASTDLSFEYGAISEAGENFLLVQGYVSTRSYSSDAGEYVVYRTASPWDEECITYWDERGNQKSQARDRIKRYVEYKIDLAKYSDTKELKQCADIRLVNRGNAAHQASLQYVDGGSVRGEYSAYQLTTSCGITLNNVTHEAIWSHCGRYLAVVHFDAPPQVPHRISIIDFETASIKKLAGTYALPSFIWFDANMLDFTHMVGVKESTIFHPGDSKTKILQISEPQHASHPYDLLIGSLEARRAELNKFVESNQSSNTNYASASVDQISQHCILFAPHFEKPVSQRYIGNKD